MMPAAAPAGAASRADARTAAKPTPSETGTPFAEVMAGASQPASATAEAEPTARRVKDGARTGKTKPADPLASPAPQAAATATTETESSAEEPVRTCGTAPKLPGQGRPGAGQDDPAAQDETGAAAAALPSDMLAALITAQQGAKPAVASLAPAPVIQQAVTAPVDVIAPPPAAQAATATPTLAILAGRIAPRGKTEKATPRSETGKAKDGRVDTDLTTASTAGTVSTPAVSASPATATIPSAAPDATTVPADTAGRQLAGGTADRQVELARSDAWLDGLARDISRTADGSSPLRFQVAPLQLGAVAVELTRGEAGSSVRLTASSETARDMLDSARPQLIAEARAHGIHIANAQVDVGSDSAKGERGQQQAQQHQQSSQNGASAQTNAGQSGSGDHRRSPPQQTFGSEFRLHKPSSGNTAEDLPSATATQPADGLYA